MLIEDDNTGKGVVEMVPKLPTISIVPLKVYLERDENSTFLNFDFQIHGSGKRYTIVAISVLVYDKFGSPILRKSLDSNGPSPGILTIPVREIPKDGAIDIFNPFERFDASIDLQYLEYVFHLTGENRESVKLKTRVTPAEYLQRVDLRLPFHGDFIVYDGHDYYSHHRRLPLLQPLPQRLGLRANSSRYAYDFCATNCDGSLSADYPSENEDFTFGKPVHCPGNGTVVDAANDIRDNIVGKPQVYSFENFIRNPMLLAGNYVVIDHGYSEYSVIGHFKQHSLGVEVGDKVIQGQVLGLAGNSGSSGIPHIHYQLQNGKNILTSEGFPSVSHEYEIKFGNSTKRVSAGFPQTGQRLRNIFETFR